MTEFGTGATIDVQVSSSSLRSARDEIESELGDVEVNVSSSTGGRGGSRIAGRERAMGRQLDTTRNDHLNDIGSSWTDNLELNRERNDLLRELVDVTETDAQTSRGGRGGMLGAVGGGLGAGIGMAAGIGALGLAFGDLLVDEAVEIGEYIADSTVDIGNYIADSTVSIGNYIADTTVDIGDYISDSTVEIGSYVTGEVTAEEITTGEVDAGDIVTGQVQATAIVTGAVAARDIITGEVSIGDYVTGDVSASDIITTVALPTLVTGVALTELVDAVPLSDLVETGSETSGEPSGDGGGDIWPWLAGGAAGAGIAGLDLLRRGGASGASRGASATTPVFSDEMILNQDETASNREWARDATPGFMDPLFPEEPFWEDGDSESGQADLSMPDAGETFNDVTQTFDNTVEVNADFSDLEREFSNATGELERRVNDLESALSR